RLVRVADDEGGPDDAALDDLLNEEGAERLRGLLVGATRAEIESARPTRDGHVVFELVTSDDRSHAAGETLSLRVQVLDDRLGLVDLHRGGGRGEGRVLGAMRGREQKNVVLCALSAAEAHDVPVAAEDRQRESVRDRLTERRKVGDDAE